MKDLSRIAALISKGAEYLYRTRVCDEDALPHGRRAYIWPLLLWLHRHDGKKEWVERARVVADELVLTVRRNSAGEMVIFPGLHHRRNYSTNAIDCGTFVDSFYDFQELCKDMPHSLESKTREVATSYVLKKITGAKDVHDQYLWAATGLAHYIGTHEKDPRASEYRRALEDVLDFWVRHHEKDGYSPYMQSDRFMGGLTPYYFSRRIAFGWYILEKAKLKRPDIESALLTATRFLATFLKPDGAKEMGLEAKRYYFWGSYEADSHPFDIYAFSKSYEKTRNEFWIDASAASLRRLFDAQIPSGAIRSRAGEQGIRDWQCDTMRTGHLAWLTRLTDEYLTLISSRKACSLRTPYSFNKASGSERVLLIGNEENWVHFVTRKGPLAGHAGERSSGLIIPSKDPITDLRRPRLFQYRARGNPRVFLRHSRLALSETFKYAVFHVWDCLYHKRAFPLAFAFLLDGFFGYIFVALFIRSTEFALEISGLTVGAHSITHDLTLCDCLGNQKEIIGRREIRWDAGDTVSITDTLTTPSRVRLSLQSGAIIVQGPRVVHSQYSLRA
ncbi:MAG: hypothetical protein HYS57_00775 [Parcubacteria group bacterium]|nr:hypothetical protein [Parcubacteria group bacterium]